MTILQNRILGSLLLFYKYLFLIASFSFRRDVISSVSLSNIFLELFVLFLQLFIFLLQLHFFFSNFFFWYMFIDSRIIIIYIITQRSHKQLPPERISRETQACSHKGRSPTLWSLWLLVLYFQN